MYIHTQQGLQKDGTFPVNFGMFPGFWEIYRKCSTPLQPYTQHNF